VTGLLIVAAALLAVMAGSEVALRGTKLQTGLGRVLVVWSAGYVALIYFLVRYGETGLLAYTIFWGGTFLSWFGVRSHIESSILLRMLYSLRQQPATETALMAEYTSRYGEAIRMEELCRGGLVLKDGDQLSVTPKGKAILGIVSKLR
jgi:hypothetical protein